ncbi:MAG: hypothetical protein WDA75_18180 [Candidatus Latescibacterota bacterium]|jgi:hypothetical protein
MTETTSRSQPPAELHWGIAYLREDIQDLRTEIRGIHARIDGLRGETTAQIIGLRSEMTAQIDTLRAEVSSRFYWTMATMVTLAGVIAAAIKL